MLYIYLNDSRFRYEVEELIKLFIPRSSYQFIDEGTLEDSQSLLLSIKYEKNADSNISVELIERGYRIDYIQSDDPYKAITKKETKDHIKRFVFKLLSTYYQYKPPWGILTGVRPSKIVNELMDAEVSTNQIMYMLREDYFVQKEKINLLMQVCKNERAILEQSSQKEISLYIGIPFCPSRCAYCSFTSYQAEEKEIELYLAALKKEITFVAEAIEKSGLKVETLYIGGGTPTTLSGKQLEGLLSHINRSLELEDLKEYTVECGRPDTINDDKLAIMRQHKVNRISINPQTMKEETLKEIGRKHTPLQIEKAYHMAKKYNFNSINMDLIAGLPKEKPDDFNHSLNALLKFSPENITVHTLSIKRTSKLRQTREEYNYKTEEYVKDMLEIASDKLKKEKYIPYYMYRQKYMSGNYENVGYSKESKKCIYNVRIMEEKQTIIALGAGAISKVYYPSENRLERVPNVSNYEIYIDRLDEMCDRKRKLIFANIDNKIDNTL